MFWPGAMMVLLLVLTGCAGASGSGSKPTPTPAGLSLEPPQFVLKAKAGQQIAYPGSFFWVAPNDMVADVQVEGVPVTGAPALTVEAKETATVDIRNGAPPQSLEMKLYPKEGNFKPAPVPGSSADSFVPTTEPVWSRQLQPKSSFTVAIDAPGPGTYYLWMKGTWPTSRLPDRPNTGVKAFILQVK